MKTKVVCFLDKNWPPNHSFVDGMLSKELPELDDLDVYLIVSGKKKEKKVRRYLKTICILGVYPRKGIHRFLNFYKAIFLIIKLKKKFIDNNIILFVRNEPIYLLACTLFKRNTKLVYQNSFPHEKLVSSFLKRKVAKSIKKICSYRVDSVLAVSPLGLKRLKEEFPKVSDAEYIPLLADRIETSSPLKNSKGKVDFIYIGDHSTPRQLEVVLSAIVHTEGIENKARFTFVGGNSKEIERLSKIDGIDNLINKNVVTFIKQVPRNKLFKILEDMDVGISLIPPEDHYLEASPTKLTEYMGMGLMVLGNAEIPFQKKIIKESGAGKIVKWDITEISNSLLDITEDRNGIYLMKRKSYFYSKTHLKYSHYLHVLNKLI